MSRLSTPPRRGLLGVVALLLLSAVGAGQGVVVRGEQKVSDLAGGFTGTLVDYDTFGVALAPLGDLGGDGTLEVAIGAPFDDTGGIDYGAVWILSLRPDGTVAGEQKIAWWTGGLHDVLGPDDIFGKAVVSVGDLDGDGVPELAVGTPGDDDGGNNHGAVWILFLHPDGTVRNKAKISDTAGNFTGQLDDFDNFGFALATPGDLDGDGNQELVVGADQDDDGGHDRGALWMLYLDDAGAVKSAHKISALEGNFTGLLDDDDRFGRSVTSIGDLDDDGVPDLAVGAFLDDDGGPERGAVWILFLDFDGTVHTTRKISALAGGFGGALDDDDRFGNAVAHVGDVDGDGRPELAVNALHDDDGGADVGAVWMLSLAPDGTVAREEKISLLAGGFGGALTAGDHFGHGLAPLGDLDGDGVLDLVAGAPLDDDGGPDRGAAWVLFLDGCPPASVAPRYGTGSNPAFLTAVNTPVLGTTWRADVDAAGHAPSLAALYVFDAPLEGVFVGAGEVLVDAFTGALLHQAVAPHTGGATPFATPLPLDLALCGFFAHAQALVLGSPGARLGNALDLVLGD